MGRPASTATGQSYAATDQEPASTPVTSPFRGASVPRRTSSACTGRPARTGGSTRPSPTTSELPAADQPSLRMTSLHPDLAWQRPRRTPPQDDPRRMLAAQLRPLPPHHHNRPAPRPRHIHRLLQHRSHPQRPHHQRPHTHRYHRPRPQDATPSMTATCRHNSGRVHPSRLLVALRVSRSQRCDGRAYRRPGTGPPHRSGGTNQRSRAELGWWFTSLIAEDPRDGGSSVQRA